MIRFAGHAAAALTLMIGCSGAWAFDSAGYKSRVSAVLAEVSTGSLKDPKATLATLDEVIQLGIAGAKEFGAANAKYAKLFDAVVADAPNIKTYTNDEAQAKWGEKGNAGAAVGIPLESLDQSGDVRNHLELVISPSEVYFFVKKYETQKKPRWLEQAKDELTELKEHAEKAK